MQELVGYRVNAGDAREGHNFRNDAFGVNAKRNEVATEECYFAAYGFPRSQFKRYTRRFHCE